MRGADPGFLELVIRSAGVDGLGEYIDFRFQPIRWPVQTLMASAPAALHIDESIAGGSRACLREDEAIVVSLATRRELGHVRPNGGWGSTGDDGGQKSFTVRPGEAVRIVLPAPGGGSTFTSDGTQTRADHRDLFAAHTTAIVITINRGRP